MTPHLSAITDHRSESLAEHKYFALQVFLLHFRFFHFLQFHSLLLHPRPLLSISARSMLRSNWTANSIILTKDYFASQQERYNFMTNLKDIRSLLFNLYKAKWPKIDEWTRMLNYWIKRHVKLTAEKRWSQSMQSLYTTRKLSYCLNTILVQKSVDEKKSMYFFLDFSTVTIWLYINKNLFFFSFICLLL